jgi:hypothetical protein
MVPTTRPSVSQSSESSFEKYETQLEPETGLRISERPSSVMPPWQTLKRSAMYLEPAEGVQLCRSLRFRGAHLYRAAAAIIKYRMTAGTMKQQAMAETSTAHQSVPS